MSEFDEGYWESLLSEDSDTPDDYYGPTVVADVADCSGTVPDDRYTLNPSDLHKRGNVAVVADVADFPGTNESVLDDVEKFVRRFCILPNEHSYVAVALWIAHTHFIERLDTTPRLACLSPEPGSGKTRVLEVASLVSRNPMMMMSPSEAVLFRVIEERQPSIFFDEVDTIFGTKKAAENNEGIRGIINGGYRVGAMVPRCGGNSRTITIEEFKVFAPVALAGLGNLPDTIMTRAVIIRMKRRSRGEKVEQFRDRLVRPEGEALQQRLSEWASSVKHLPYPKLPDGVEDRDADVWEPLLMAADAAGGTWPKRGREACAKFISEKPASAVSLGIRLLTDIKTIWPQDEATIGSADLMMKLHDLDESPWADLGGDGINVRGISKLLADYDIHSSNVRTSTGVRKGYKREDFWDPWHRYLPEAA